MKLHLRNLIKSNNLSNFLYEFGISYPTPSNLNYFWNFGFLALVFLVIQIITGIVLAMHYTPHVELAFNSIENIMRNVNYGYLLRYLHMNGASAFFLVVYIHILKGFYYSSYSYPRQVLWFSGILILLLMIMTAFMGYVLVWGQMSFWAATVITNLFSVIPYFGEDFVNWLWGGFSIENPTLNRFFSLHYLLPFLILAVVGFHLICLHNWGSSNPLGLGVKVDSFSFTPYFLLKDLYFLFIFLVFFCLFVFFYPNYLGHTDNYIVADPLVTPIHIVPEWYFLPFYAILRAFPNKIFGVLFFVFSIVLLFLLPFYVTINYKSLYFRPLFQSVFWLFCLSLLVLGWVGGKPVEPVYYFIDQIVTFFYFFFLLFILPIFSFFFKFFI